MAIGESSGADGLFIGFAIEVIIKFTGENVGNAASSVLLPATF
ncbi:hypothetical protein [Permianibacter fluminis]|nr:hypothetical protein [Permianibacter fluminis]